MAYHQKPADKNDRSQIAGTATLLPDHGHMTEIDHETSQRDLAKIGDSKKGNKKANKWLDKVLSV